MGALAEFHAFCDTIGLRLEAWQDLILEEVFGPRRELLVTMPRGNGKTTLAAALCVFELLRDPAANIVLAAASRDQAAICFDEARKLAIGDPVDQLPCDDHSSRVADQRAAS